MYVTPLTNVASLFTPIKAELDWVHHWMDQLLEMDEGIYVKLLSLLYPGSH